MSSGRHLGVLINPTAGHGRGAKRGLAAMTALRDRGFEVTDLSGPDELTATVNAAAAVGHCDALVVIGGDGMVHLGVNAVAETGTPLGIIAVGSGNDLARSLGLPIHDVNAAADAIAAAFGGPTQFMDAIRLTFDHNGGGPARADTRHRWSGCVVSAGFDSMVNARANTYTWPWGIGRYIRGVLRELLTFTHYDYRLEIDGEVREFPGALVALANASTFGGGMKIAPAASVTDGLIDVVVADKVTRWELLKVFPTIFSGNHVHHPAVTVINASHVRISASDGGVIPQIFADGELQGAAPVTAEIHPAAVRLLCPPLDRPTLEV